VKAESAHTDTIRTGPSTTPACRNAQGSAKLPAPITAFRRWAEAASVLIFPWVGAMTALTIGLLVGCSGLMFKFVGRARGIAAAVTVTKTPFA
jgi:hypothetical protein